MSGQAVYKQVRSPYTVGIYSPGKALVVYEMRRQVCGVGKRRCSSVKWVWVGPCPQRRPLSQHTKSPPCQRHLTAMFQDERNTFNDCVGAPAIAGRDGCVRGMETGRGRKRWMYFTLSQFDQAPRQTRVEGHTRSTLEARRTASSTAQSAQAHPTNTPAASRSSRSAPQACW